MGQPQDLLYGRLQPGKRKLLALAQQLARGHHGAQTAGIEELHLAQVQQNGAVVPPRRRRCRITAQMSGDLRKPILELDGDRGVDPRRVRPHDPDARPYPETTSSRVHSDDLLWYHVSATSFQLVDARMRRRENQAMDTVVIAGAARTPMGGFQGELSPLTAAELGGAAISAALGARRGRGG
jgi:hypothetical protein